MLVLSRKKNEVIEIFPRPIFAEKIAEILKDFFPNNVKPDLAAILKHLQHHPALQMRFFVTDVRGDKVRIGIEADSMWAVLREEIANDV